MSDLIRQSVSWPYAHGVRSYSRITSIAPVAAEADKPATEELPTGTGKDGSGGGSGKTRGALIDILV